jgi:hypothetical protein
VGEKSGQVDTELILWCVIRTAVVTNERREGSESRAERRRRSGRSSSPELIVGDKRVKYVVVYVWDCLLCSVFLVKVMIKMQRRVGEIKIE